MLRHYFLIAVRALRRRPVHTFINASSLAVGLACCLLIGLWIRDEMSYDRFYPEAENIHRVLLDGVMSGRTMYVPLTPYPLSAAMVEEMPGVAASTRLFDLFDNTMVRRRDGRTFVEKQFFFADSTFFDVFDVPFVEGDQATALDEPRSLVLTRSTAQKYFAGRNPVGETMTAVDDTLLFTVTGVIEDIPSNAHFHFDFLAPMAGMPQFDVDSWIFNTVRTYARLVPEADPEEVAAGFEGIMRKYAAGDIEEFSGLSFAAFWEEGNRLDYALQPITDIHLRSNLEFELEPTGSITFVYVFASVAVLILLIACINFMNLTTARSIGRAREIGIRKVLGSARMSLVRQFLFESVVLSLAAMLISAALVAAVLPAFNGLTGKEVTMATVLSPQVMLALVGLAALVGLFAGSYPAFFLSGFRPVHVLKGQFQHGATGRFLRSGLVVFQFAISIGLIAGTLIVFDQLTYMQEKDPGFDEEHLIVIDRADELGSRIETFKETIAAHPAVVGAGATSTLPGGNLAQWALRPDGSKSAEQILMTPVEVDYDYLELMDIALAEGRLFSREHPTDSSALILNEAGVRSLGWEEPLGRRLQILGEEVEQRWEVVGVTRDFHVASYHVSVVPVMMRLARTEENSLDQIVVRFRPDALSDVLAFLENSWASYLPDEPFVYSFLEEDLEALYSAEQRLGRMFRWFTALTILIACMGLFGLTSYSVQNRTKEIGVRKVLGAGVPGLVALLSREFVVLVAVAFVLAAPLSWFAMRWWLSDFAYRVSPGPGVFILAGLGALVIALATLGYHTIRAATADPVDSLRVE